MLNTPATRFLNNVLTNALQMNYCPSNFNKGVGFHLIANNVTLHYYNVRLCSPAIGLNAQVTDRSTIENETTQFHNETVLASAFVTAAMPS